MRNIGFLSDGRLGRRPPDEQQYDRSEADFQRIEMRMDGFGQVLTEVIVSRIVSFSEWSTGPTPVGAERLHDQVTKELDVSRTVDRELEFTATR